MSRKYTPAQVAARNEGRNELRALRTAAGLCAICRAVVPPERRGKRYCQTCAATQIQSHRAWVARKDSVRLDLRLTREEKEGLTQLARARGLTTNALVRLLIRQAKGAENGGGANNGQPAPPNTTA